MSYNPILITNFSFNPLFFKGLKNELGDLEDIEA